jgi:hypothetical protein
MFGEPVFVFPGLLVQNSPEPVLRAVRLIGNHDDIGSRGELWIALFVSFRHKLLYRAKDDSSRRAAV